jgi:Ubiquitin elongating factor core
MSNLLPDLASWALRGGAAATEETETPSPTMTPQALRAQRLARLEALQPSAAAEAEPMAPAGGVGESTNETARTPLFNTERSLPVAAATPSSSSSSSAAALPKAETTPRLKKAKNATGTNRQRQKEQLLYQCLSVQLAGTAAAGPDAVLVDIGSTEISVRTIAEIIAVRLARGTRGVIGDLGRAATRTFEIRRAAADPEDQALLQELQQQIVAYAATCIVEPDVFPAVSHQVPEQIATALLQDPPEILRGGAGQSFWALLMDDLQQQDAGVFQSTVHAMLDFFCALLLQTDSVLGTIAVPTPSNATETTTTTTLHCTPTHIVTALTSMCSLHKGVAAQVADYPYFLLPPAGNTTTPPPFLATASSSSASHATVNPLWQLLSGGGAALTPMQRWMGGGRWQPRSGLAMEHGTLLGLCLRVGIPKPPGGTNPAFSASAPAQLLRQSQPTIDSLTRTQRQQLSLHQGECYNFIMALLKVKDRPAKQHIMTWFTDVLRVNVGASALRPDTTIVSSTNLLLHVSMMLLRLCQPFVNAPDKEHLIDPGFVRHAHGGVLDRTGEQAVPRLGGETVDDTVLAAEYQPKNAFIPFCFFFCAHALHLSIVPALRQNEHLLRHISHYHHEVLARDGHVDAMQNDPRFASLIARQRSEDVALFQEDYRDRVLEFSNFTARVLYQFLEREPRILAHMPEEFVSDICDILVSIVTLKPPSLAGHDFRGVFQLLVHLLSPQYATVRVRAGDGGVERIPCVILSGAQVHISPVFPFLRRWCAITTYGLS